MEYQVVYDVFDKPNPITYFEFFWLFWVVIVVLTILYKSGSKLAGLFGVLFGVSCFYMVLVNGPEMQMYMAEHWGLTEAYKSGDYEIVEGIVERFNSDACPDTNIKCDGFFVEGVRFLYPTHKAGYSRTKGQGGKVREGSHVIIWYVDDMIIHLEIAVNDLIQRER